MTNRFVLMKDEFLKNFRNYLAYLIHGKLSSFVFFFL